jgi:hypothetical protein
VIEAVYLLVRQVEPQHQLVTVTLP